MLLRNSFVVTTILGAVVGCGGSDINDSRRSGGADSVEKDETIEKEKEAEIKDKTAGKLRQPCRLDETKLPAEFTIDSVIALVNILPKPVTIPCIIDVLPRPLALNATTSQLSVQPAGGQDSPRIFIAIDSLLISFALSGEGSGTLEFGELLSNSLSVKGEIAFPVNKPLAATAAFQQIRSPNITGTRCSSCHAGEEAPSGFPAGAFASKALRPFPQQNVPLIDLEIYKDSCDANDMTERCEILRSLWRGGNPVPYSFPLSMPTMF